MLANFIPFIGFGFLDNAIMILAVSEESALSDFPYDVALVEFTTFKDVARECAFCNFHEVPEHMHPQQLRSYQYLISGVCHRDRHSQIHSKPKLTGD